MPDLYLRDAVLAAAAFPLPAFPFYLDGPAGECFGAEPADDDGRPAVRLVALALPVCVERGPGYAPVRADLAGAEGLVSVETVRERYLQAGDGVDPEAGPAWTLREGAPLPDVLPVAALSAAVALSVLASPSRTSDAR